MSRSRALPAPRRLGALSLALLVTLLGLVPALGQVLPESPALAGSGPASGMLLIIQPSPGGAPPNSLQRIYPDETGLASVTFGQSLDVQHALLSPDGSEIALYARGSGNVGKIYIGSADGKRLDEVPVDATHMGLEDWHPNGDELLVWHFTDGQYDLKRLSRSGQLTALTSTPGVDEMNGRWAPDGARFSFTAAGLNGESDVFVQQVGTTAVNITNSPESEGPAEWSPAGNRLLYARGESLIVSDVSGANSRPLNPGAPLRSYGWAPGGEIYARAHRGIESLTLDQIKRIFTGEVKNWKEVGGADAPILLYGRENNSGTYAFFKEEVLDDEDFAAETQSLPGTAAVVNAVANDPKAIGYGGIAWGKGIRTVPVRREAGDPAVEPTMENVTAGTYPISRKLFLYTAGALAGDVKAFIDFALSEEGQRIAADVGYYPLPKPAPAAPAADGAGDADAPRPRVGTTGASGAAE